MAEYDSPVLSKNGLFVRITIPWVLVWRLIVLFAEVPGKHSGNALFSPNVFYSQFGWSCYKHRPDGRLFQLPSYRVDFCIWILFVSSASHRDGQVQHSLIWVKSRVSGLQVLKVLFSERSESCCNSKRCESWIFPFKKLWVKKWGCCQIVCVFQSSVPLMSCPSHI